MTPEPLSPSTVAFLLADQPAADVTRPAQQALHERRMHAIVRKNTSNPAKPAPARHALDEFQALHAAQPGIAGSIDTETGQGQRIIVNLWQTGQDARAAGRRPSHPRAAPAKPLTAGPSQLIGSGKWPQAT